MVLFPFLAIAAGQTLQVRDIEAQIQQSASSDAAASVLAQKVKSWFGPELAKGGIPKVDQTTVVWAAEADSVPSVISDDGTFKLPLTQIGKTKIYIAVSHLRSGRAFPFHYTLGKVKQNAGFVEVYDDEPDMFVQSGVPKGQLVQMPSLTSKLFDKTTRDWWIYIPAGAPVGTGAPFMVFQDGQTLKDYVPTCLDNLIAKRQIPPIVGIFVAPGTKPDGKSNRSFEYDTLSDLYARFLLEELLPLADKKVNLTSNPDQRAVCGMSSGGICAFTVAWQKPQQFHKVLSMIGSFTDIAHGDSQIEGGHNYPYLIRLTERKPLRVYLQDGLNDLDNQFGNWPLANQSMAKALAFRGYDYTFRLGEGNHSDRMTRAILPDMLKWLWR